MSQESYFESRKAILRNMAELRLDLIYKGIHTPPNVAIIEELKAHRLAELDKQYPNWSNKEADK